jgi:hypothetical protein
MLSGVTTITANASDAPFAGTENSDTTPESSVPLVTVVSIFIMGRAVF